LIVCLCEWIEFDFEIVNLNGGVIVIGYLFGCLGVWLLILLVYEFKCCGGGWGLVMMCIGVG